jgi:rod shape-determining protein MreD
MRWLPYFILAYLMLGLQIGIIDYVSIGNSGAWPNLVLLAAIWIAINAPRDAALLGCFGLGLIQDLTSQQNLGIFAFSYGLVAMFTVSTQQVVYRGHPLTHFSLALVGMFMTSLVILIHGLYPGPRVSPMTLFYSSLYTAVLAPFVLGLLGRIRKLFAFQPIRRKMRI